MPEPEVEAKPPNPPEDTEKKKPKKPKKTSNIHSAITGFEEAFEQFATSSNKKSMNTVVSHPEVRSPADIKLEVSSNQVSLFSFKSM